MIRIALVLACFFVDGFPNDQQIELTQAIREKQKTPSFSFIKLKIKIAKKSNF